MTRTIALAGNPNVGKSTVFNGLTGMHQHTGNWPGKTVSNARGTCCTARHNYTLVDIPGTYSLMAHSAEEEIARDYLCFDAPDAVLVVCDATCLERNLNLVLQTMELGRPVVLCVNLLDEAKRKGIRVDLALLSERLGVPVVGTTAREKRSLSKLLAVVEDRLENGWTAEPMQVHYPVEIEAALAKLRPQAAAWGQGRLPSRWLALQLLLADATLLAELEQRLGPAPPAEDLRSALRVPAEDSVTEALLRTAQEICRVVVTQPENCHRRDRKLDRLLTSRATGYPMMLLLLVLIFWLTLSGANIPSSWLMTGFAWLEGRLGGLLLACGAPPWLYGVLIDGAFHVLAWVVSVMLPPMAIFFPLFTLLEDVGYLPRIAYNLDGPFQRCSACGKQALTMCMGFGCNAAGVVGCRIIDSPRERLLAVLTNSLVPCNGRFPTLVALITMFFLGTAGGWLQSVRAALLLCAVIAVGVVSTFALTKLLSVSLLRGTPSAFTLELPPYRRPQIGQVLLRSLVDRTLFVLRRAAMVSAPAGALIWILANTAPGGVSLLSRCAAALDPLGRAIGLDGVLLLAFLLGLPANEIVLPVAVMAYLAQGSLTQLGELTALRPVLEANGWTTLTALNVMLFSLLHWPCSTTLLTIRKETGSWRWTLLAAVLPTALGILVCALTTAIASLF